MSAQRWLLIAGWCAGIACGWPSPVWSDPQADWDDLKEQVTSHCRAGQFREAEQAARQLLRLAEGPYGSKNLVSYALNELGFAYNAQGRYEEAEAALQRALAIESQRRPSDLTALATKVGNLAETYHRQGRYAEAMPLKRRALELREQVHGPDHPKVASDLSNLACLYADLDRFDEAERLHKRALAIHEKALSPDHLGLPVSLSSLGVLYVRQGRYAEAEPLLKRGMELRRMVLPAGHPSVALELNNLALLHSAQRRFAEAEPLLREAMAMQRANPGRAENTGLFLANLGAMAGHQGRYAEAERLILEALEIWQSGLNPSHEYVRSAVYSLARTYAKQGRNAEAEQWFSRALATAGDSRDFPALRVELLWRLAEFQIQQGHDHDAEKSLNEAASILADKRNLAVVDRFHVHQLRASLGWRLGRQGPALEDLAQALECAEEQRVWASGGAYDRARLFAEFARAYEDMVAWHTELRDPPAVFDAIERSRARSLLDQLAAQGVGILGGVSDDYALTVLRRAEERRTELMGLHEQLSQLARRVDLALEERKTREETLAAKIERQRQAYVLARADLEAISPIYQLAAARSDKRKALSRLQHWVDVRQAALFEYFLGEEAGWVLVVTNGRPPRVEKLTVSDEIAAGLDAPPGPLTVERLNKVCRKAKGDGLLQHLQKPKQSEEVAPVLAAFWELLVPQSEREAILAGKYKQIIVIPDGPLAQLPFETLVVQSRRAGEESKHLLDVGPPILYAPSATVLMNLAQREEKAEKPASEPVLTVGDCRYHVSAAPAPQDVLAELAPRSRYAGVGGSLRPLPYSAWEVQWVANVFGQQGRSAAWLKQDLATEAAVRANVPGRRVLHFACHGLVDQSHGNLFGALALTPGSDPDNPADDGFLTLAEIYELNLKGCELTMLSACDTNVGPEQRGEGVWALSRGFLVAGSRRVVASNWLVDDEAAASLISYFCSAIAQAEKDGKTPDYAKALHEAKRWVRQQEKWKSPYYWGTFVLIGPM